MIRYLDDLLFDTDLDLSLSVIMKEDPAQFIVSSRPGAPRIAVGLLFGLPCLDLMIGTSPVPKASTWSTRCASSASATLCMDPLHASQSGFKL